MLLITVLHLNLNKKITGVTDDNGRYNVEIMKPLKYLSNFWRILEMPSVNCEINLILTWSDICVLFKDTKATKFTKQIQNVMFQL